MKLSFRRITSSGNFIPEIDGLRFIAITSVLLYHINGFIMEKDTHQYKRVFDYSFLQRVLSHGYMGVPLFFVISGFILGMPFAKSYIRKKNRVSLKKYFLRRLTRIEPPYILVMTILLFGSVYVAKTLSLNMGIRSYLASIIYSHNFIFPHVMPLINAPAWSLEIEVQFYILAPLIAYVFFIKTILKRRVVLLCLIAFFLILNSLFILPFVSLINYAQYFLVGFLISEIIVSNSVLLPKTKFDSFIGLSFFLLFWIFDKSDFQSHSGKFIWQSFQLLCIFITYYYVMVHKIFNKVLSYKAITNIGGMCYSIYLIHYPIISLFGNPLLRHSFSKYAFINVSIYSFLLILAVMTISSLFFLLIERPCMNKDWYKRFLMKRHKLAIDKRIEEVSEV
jgi:peptidoglycan/LPS O-acetylase OafA/YrhL